VPDYIVFAKLLKLY